MSSNEMRRLMTLVESATSKQKLDEISLSSLKSGIKSIADKFRGSKAEESPEAEATPAPERDPEPKAEPAKPEVAKTQQQVEKEKEEPADYAEVSLIDAVKDKALFDAKAKVNALTYGGELVVYNPTTGFSPHHLGGMLKNALPKVKQSRVHALVPNVDIHNGKALTTMNFNVSAVAATHAITAVYIKNHNSFGFFIPVSFTQENFDDQYDYWFKSVNKVDYDESNDEHQSSKIFADSFVFGTGRKGLAFIEVKSDGSIGEFYVKLTKLHKLPAMVKEVTKDFIVDNPQDALKVFKDNA